MPTTPSPSDPAIDLVPVDVSGGDQVLSPPARALRCKPDGTAGTVTIVTLNGEVRPTAITVGEILPVNFSQVNQSGTAATGLEGMI